MSGLRIVPARLRAELDELEATLRRMLSASESPASALESLEQPQGDHIHGLADAVGALARRWAEQAAQSEGQIALLETAREAAEAADRRKSEFLATISHELRTPLNGVLAMAEVMAADDLGAAQRERLAVVLSSGEAVIQLLNDVLDLARIEAGQLPLESIPFDPGRIAEEAVAAFRPLAASRGLLLQLIVTDAAHAPRLGDPARLRQVLNNLIANSLKFTSAGRVKVEMRIVDDSLRLSVTDTGVGLEADQLERVFEKYASGDSRGRHSSGGGAGLGLAISRDICQLMGGRIWAEPDRPKGAAFHVRLPLSPAPVAADAGTPVPLPSQPPLQPLPASTGPKVPDLADLTSALRETDAAPAMSAEPEPDPAEPDRPLRVLAAEDNTTNRLVLEAMVGILGFDMDIVGDGQAAVEAWQLGDYDVVLMDIQMPVMDGLEATRRIRAEEQRTGRPRTAIVAVSANAMNHQVAEYLAAGMDRHVAKPIELARLHGAIVEALTAPSEVVLSEQNTTTAQNGQA
jgi:signal transduction histidine kinase/AmiR/NasT family two-component response regulator